MKKLISIAAAAIISIAAYAQVQVGAGYVQSTASYQSKPEADVNYTQSNGFYAGVGYEYPFMQGLSLSFGAYYEYLYSDDAASTALGSAATGTLKTNLKEQYVNIPLALNFGYNLTPSLRLFAFGGPTFQVGLSSVSHYDASVSVIGINIDKSGDFDNYANVDEDTPSSYGRYDIMLGAGAGADILGKFRVTVGYDWGMLNRNVNQDDTSIRKRNQLRAGIAFLF